MSIKRNILTICIGLIIILNLSIGVFATPVDPLYVPHECHPGPEHQNCEYVHAEEKCGCYADGFYCCCGKLMYFEKYFCSEHQY